MIKRFTQYRSVLLLTFCLVTSGCGGSGIDRQDLEGAVTFKDSPVPYGRISFRPDRSKGGTGPAGVAVIRDGKYSTAASGKGAVSGPLVVVIQGLFNDSPASMPLFTPFKTEAEVTPDLEELDFVVPAEAAWTKKKSRRNRR